MKMLNLNDIIADYLQSNRRLVVPEFGAFVVKETAEVVFSELLQNDDGVLSSLLAAQGLNEMEIAVVVDRYIFEVRHELERYGYCRLGRLGTLRLEPTTKRLKLYKVKDDDISDIIENKPYQPSAEKATLPTEKVETKVEEKEAVVPQNPNASRQPRPRPNKKRGVDTIMILAIVILVCALAAIAFGYYVSNLSVESDEEKMEALRVQPNQTID
ncbi:MAG: hypothetical protein IKV09_02515 [Alistipes sp.]|nr:hypothetical protein [Alistipes sp.]